MGRVREEQSRKLTVLQCSLLLSPDLNEFAVHQTEDSCRFNFFLGPLSTLSNYRFTPCAKAFTRLQITLRAFFYALSHSNLNYYQSNWLYTHQRTMLVASTLSSSQVPDEVLGQNSHGLRASDESYSGWVHITWEVSREGTPLIYHNVDGWYGEDWMRDCFLSTISSLNSGVIRDYWTGIHQYYWIFDMITPCKQSRLLGQDR